MSDMESIIKRAERWDPNSVKPLELFHSPDLSLLCARDIEGQFYERKSKRPPDKLAETICAFANTNRDHGGLIAVGISDAGDVDGIRNRPDVNVNSLRLYHHYTGANTRHKFVDCKNLRGDPDQVLLIYVPYLEDRVAETSKGKAFVRRGDKTEVLRDAEKRELEYNKGQISFEDEKADLYSDDMVVDEILEQLRNSIIAADNATSDISTEKLLLSKHLLRKDEGKSYLTKAGVLLLAKDPRKCLPGAYVRFLRYDGTERKSGAAHNVVKDETFSDPLPRLVQRLKDFMKSQLREFTSLGTEGTFVQEPEYPEEAWLETLVNALIHRSYSLMNTPVFVEMYDDRLEVRSPGDYPAGVHPREFIHNPRNPHLMEGMKYLRFVRMLSEGSLRMVEAMERANLPVPEFSRPGNQYVRVVLRNEIERRVKERMGEASQVPEFLNVFRITWADVDEKHTGSQDVQTVPSPGEVRKAIVAGLRAQGYAVDSFFEDAVADVQNEYDIPALRESGLASIYPGFRFRVLRLSGAVYLAIDHAVHVRNRATLDKLLKIAPGLRARGFRKGFLRSEGSWVPCEIKEIREQGTVTVKLWRSPDPLQKAVWSDVLPMVPTTWIAEILDRSGVSISLVREVKRLSLNLSRNAGRERSRRTMEIAKRLSQTVFPLRVRGYRLFLEEKPKRAKPPALRLCNDLSDPEPVFSKEAEGRARTVINGLSTYGSYEKPGREVPLVLLCTHDRVEQMERLVDLVRKGSAKYRGLEKTFSLSFGEVTVESVDSPGDYVARCRQICASVPSNAVFLVYCPEQGYSRADYHSPYYQVKHFLLEAGFPSQMVDEQTLEDPRFKDYNLGLDIFAKAGYVPWVLSAGLPDADLFLGISYSSIQGDRGQERLIGYVNVFDQYGKWLYYKGNTRPIDFEKRNEAFRELLRDVAREYQKKARLHRMHVHHGFKLSHEARNAIADGVKQEVASAEVSFVYVNSHSPFRLYDDSPEGDGTMARGKYVVMAPNRFVIATTGQNELGQRGLGTPRPLDVRVNRVHSKGELDTRVYAQHVLSLTRLNWASTKDFCREPITLKYASDIAYLMNVFLASFGEFKLHPKLENTPWFL